MFALLSVGSFTHQESYFLCWGDPSIGDPASPKHALFSLMSLAQEQILLLHWGHPSRGYSFPSEESLHQPAWPAPVLRDPKRGQTKKISQVHSQSQQRLDQDAKTLLAAFEVSKEQVPMQKFIQQPERQQDSTRIQGSHNKKTWTPYSRRSRRNRL